MADSRLFGQWSSYKEENLEAVFAVMGLSWMARKLGSKINVTVSIEDANCDEIVLAVRSLMINTDTRLPIGRQAKWNGGTSTELDCLTCWEDGKLVIYMGDAARAEDLKQSGRKQVRELLDNGDLLLTIEWDGTIAKRWFHRDPQ